MGIWATPPQISTVCPMQKRFANPCTEGANGRQEVVLVLWAGEDSVFMFSAATCLSSLATVSSLA